MTERLIPISKKQHDSFQNIQSSIQHANDTLTTIANTILQGVDDDLGQVGVTGVTAKDGVYALIIDVPEKVAEKSAEQIPDTPTT